MYKPTIVAPATPPGRGGVAIVRISGEQALSIAQIITRQNLTARHAHFSHFYDNQQQIIDEGIAIYFSSPASFTGEDIVEFHTHGSPVIVDRLIRRLLECGAIMARPGEFSERAFLNGKIDLVQAEAIADLISAETEVAADSAMRSLTGTFSQKISEIVTSVIDLRMYVEAAIDFAQEEIDFLSDEKVFLKLKNIISEIELLQQEAKIGSLIREGATFVIVGKPNAGKSSLLNYLTGQEKAIVSEIAGTTRDVIQAHIQIDGIPIELIDTAGFHHSEDVIEQEGMKRALNSLSNAHHVLLIVDQSREFSRDIREYLPDFVWQKISNKPLTFLFNKIDLTEEKARIDNFHAHPAVYLSLKANTGTNLLIDHLRSVIGSKGGSVEGKFMARRRHLEAIEQAHNALMRGFNLLTQQGAGELLAEELLYTQRSLNEITGEFTQDDLLTKIFSSFCIGK